MTRFSFPFFFWRPGDVLLSGNMPDVCAATRKVKSLHSRHDPLRQLRRNHPQVRQTAAAVTWCPQIHSRQRQLKHFEEGADTEGASPEAEPAGLSPCTLTCVINNKDPHSPGWWLSRAGSWRPPSLALPTADHGLIQGAGSGRSGPGPGSCLTSLRLQGVQGEVTGVAERQTAARAAAAQGWKKSSCF